MIGTSARLQTGDSLTINDLLYGLLLPSGNDAAMALAIYCSGVLNGFGTKPFVEEMNLHARRLGMQNTTFNNPHGLGDYKNKSSAQDICKLASHVLRTKRLSKIVATPTYACHIRNTTDVRLVTWEYTNRLLGEGFIGVKTGVT
jgi:D-alanyl-D-alanine carboxypeptidase